jgi:AcrR family transcriptional regulator
MSSQRSPRRDREAVRASILDAAAELFGERGISGATIDDVAARAGFTKGAVYSNFASKDELVVQLMRSHVDDQQSAAAAVLRPELSLTELLAALPQSLGTITAARRMSYDLASEFRMHALRNPTALPGFIAMRRAAHEGVLAIVHRYLHAHPELAAVPVTAEQLARLIMAVILGVAFDADVLDDPSAAAVLTPVLAAVAASAAGSPPGGTR